MNDRVRKLKKKIEPYIYLFCVFAMGVIFIFHLVNDIINRNYDHIDDTVKEYLYSNESLDQSE